MIGDDVKQLRCLTAYTLCLAAAMAAGAASAAPLMPSFADAPTGWTTDRYAPASFTNVGAFQGRDDVLGIGISAAQGSANRAGGQQTDFYNTQGMKYLVSGGAGSTLAADLFIDAAWRDSTQGNIRSDMWGVTNAPSLFPIIGFTNEGGTGRYRVWDSDAGGWNNVAPAVNYGAWTSFEILFTGTAFEFMINGAVVYTDNTVGSAVGFTEIIMQAYNFNDTLLNDNTPTGFVGGDYVAHWDNARANGVPEPATLALVGLGLLGASAARRRKA
jgi:hypothetical protein